MIINKNNSITLNDFIDDKIKNPYKNCKNPCNPVCKEECRIKKQSKCNKFKSNVRKVKNDKANLYKMQLQLASALKQPIPKYARKIKSTPGKGTGCGHPPVYKLPPLWMYSLGTQREHRSKKKIFLIKKKIDNKII